jgi:hypothetical protein
LGISGLDPRTLAFSTPENAPTGISLGLKKKLEKKRSSKPPQKNVEVLELALHDDIYLVMGVRDSKGEAGEP